MERLILVIIFLLLMVAIIVKKLVKNNKAKEETERFQEIAIKYQNSSEEEILVNEELSDREKTFLLVYLFKREAKAALQLVNIANSEKKRIELRKIKRNIRKAHNKLSGNIPENSREPIPDEVKEEVWRRDQGKCVKCGSQEKLEYDHIIPFAKGGSNTTRNLQLLCEECNRSKSDNIA